MPVPARSHEARDPANGFANNGYGQRRMQLDPAAVRDPGEQARETTTH